MYVSRSPKTNAVSMAARIPTHARRLGLVFLSLALFVPGTHPALAGSLNVIPEAAFTGNFGLRAGVGSSCTGSNDLTVPDGTLTGGTFEGCTTLTANAVVIDGSVTFRAGRSIALGSGFSVASEAQFTAGIDSTLPREAYVRTDSPMAEKTYSAIFEANIDSLTLGTDEVELFTAYDSSGTPQLRVKLRFNVPLSEKRIFVEARQDAGTFLSSAGSEAPVSPGWHSIQVAWQAASGPGMNDGSLNVFLDASQVPQTGLSNLDNDLAQIDFVRWGAIGVGTVATGSLDLDDFTSFR